MVVLFILLQIMSLYNPSHIKYLNRYFKHFMFMGFFYRKNQLTHCFKLPVDILVNISLQILRHIQIQICSWWQITFFLLLVRKIIAKSQHYTFMVGGSKFFPLITYFDQCVSENIVGQDFCNVFLCQKPKIVIFNLFIRVLRNSPVRLDCTALWSQ